MTHISKHTGVAAVVVQYLLQAGMILWGPPPVKAAGVAWAAAPGADVLAYSFGYWAGSGIGHSDRVDKLDVFTGLVEVFSDDECDPFHPDWAQRCIGVPSPF